MGKIKSTIENNFSLLLLIGFISGFFFSGVGDYLGDKADEIAIILTAVLIFLSCADIKPVTFLEIDIFQVGSFSLIRYTILPLILFYAAHHFFPQFSTGVLLLALMPAGVSVAALCSMARGNVVLGLSITILSSLLAPVLIFAVFSFLGHTISVDVWKLFLTLVFVVFVPVILYFGVVYKSKKMAPFVKKYSQASSVVILSFILFIVMATQKEYFLDNVDTALIAFFVMLGLFAIFYLFGFICSFFVQKKDRISYIFASGAMNNSLSVGLAFAYFDANVVLFIVMSEIVWSLYVGVMQWGFSKKIVHTKLF